MSDIPSSLRLVTNIKGDKGDTGTLAFLEAVPVPFDQPPWAEMIGPEDHRGARLGLQQGMPGVNAVENDEAVAAYIANGTTHVSQALQDRYSWADELVTNVARYGLDEDGFSAALAAAVAAAPDGGTIYVPPGEYTATAQINNQGKSLRFDMNGVRILQGFNGTLGIFSGAWSDIVPTLVANVQQGGRFRTKLTLGGGIDLAPGDVVKVIADNVIPDGRPGSAPGFERRVGEFAVVNEVVGSEVWLTGLLRDTYTDNPRVAKIMPVTVEWDGGSFYGSDLSFIEKWTLGVFRFTGLLYPRLRNFRIERGSSIGAEFRSCYGPVIHEYTVDHLADDNTAGQLGYAVLDASCEGMVFADSVARRIRHAFTDDTSQVEAGSSAIANYGRSRRAIISNVHAHGATSSAFAPHHNGAHHLFIGCTAHQGSGTAFAMRGVRHVIADCISVDNDRALTVVQDNTLGGGRSYGHVAVNFRSTGVRQDHLMVYNDRTLWVVPDGVSSLEVIGGTFDGAGSTWLRVAGGRVRLAATPRWAAPPTLVNDSAAIVISGGQVEGTPPEFDYRQNTAGTGLLLATQGASTPMSLELIGDWRVYNDTLATRMATNLFGNTSGGSGNAMWRVLGLILSIPVSQFPAASPHPDSVIQWRTADGRFSSRLVERLNDQIASALPFTRRTPDPVIFIRGRSTLATSRTLGKLAEGAFVGQLAIIQWVSSVSGSTLTIRDSLADQGVITGTGANIVLASGKSLTLVWDGEAWRPTS